MHFRGYCVYYYSMDLFSDLYTTLQNDLTVDSASSFLPINTIKLAINRAYRKAGGLFFWPETEDAKKTSTVATQEYYDYPVNWRPNSIWKLKVDSSDFGEPLLMKDYLFEKENNFPSGLQKLWTNQWRRYFFTPLPTADGNNNIEVWGQKVVDKLVNDSDVTIFSYSMPECNEAILLEASAILKNKGELLQPVMRSFIGGTQLLNAEAQNILSVAYGKIRATKSRYQKTMPFFEVPDLFYRPRSMVKTSIKIGNF